MSIFIYVYDVNPILHGNHNIYFCTCVRSYIGIQNGRRMFDFVQRYLREVNTQSFAFGHSTMCIFWRSGSYGVPSLKRITSFVLVTQLDGNVDHFTFYHTGNLLMGLSIFLLIFFCLFNQNE